MTKIYFRHGSYREEQDSLIKDVCSTINESKIGLFEAPTGLGKTDAVLSSALSLAGKKTVFYLTPKTTQHKLALEVVEDINKKYGLELKAVNILGKQKMCSEIPNYNNSKGFYEFCESKLKSGTCKAFKNFKNKNYNKQIHLENVLSAETILDFGISNNVCPYELAIELTKRANLVICDYNYLFSPKVMQTFMLRSEKELEEAILIIDEAHNLGERIKSNLSQFINKKLISEGIKELEKIEEGDFSYLAEKLKQLLLLIKEKKGERELLVDTDFLKTIFENGYKDFPALEPEHIKTLEKNFENENIILPYIYTFFSSWFEENKSTIRIIKSGEDGELSIFIKYLDPAVVTKNIFKKVDSAILMSGTLTPQKMYSDILGLPRDTKIFTYKNPFPKENKLVMYDDSFSTKYELRNSADLEKVTEKIAKVINNTMGNIAIFLPSHRLASEFYNLLSEKTAKKVYLQDKNTQKSKKMIDEFKKSKGLGSVLLGVLGGSFSEGLDFPGEQLIGVFILGIPFPEPTLEIKEAIKYYDEKFANGWNYAYTYPTFSKVIQATGRCIRTNEDRGFIVLIDQRYTWSKYQALLPDDLKPRLEMSEKLIESFFNKK